MDFLFSDNENLIRPVLPRLCYKYIKDIRDLLKISEKPSLGRDAARLLARISKILAVQPPLERSSSIPLALRVWRGRISERGRGV